VTSTGSSPGLKMRAPARPQQLDRVALDAQHRSLAQAHDDEVVLLVELADPRLARLAHVRRAGDGIQVVRVDLERNQPERLERERLDDRHVVRGHDRRAGEVRARARAGVGHALFHAATDRQQRIQVVEHVEQAEGVAAPAEDRLGTEDRSLRVPALMERVEPEADLLERGARPRRVTRPVLERERDEEHALHPAQDVPQLVEGVLEVPRAEDGGRADKKQAASHASKDTPTGAPLRRERPVPKSRDIEIGYIDRNKEPA
jgi:hypothetical protein